MKNKECLRFGEVTTEKLQFGCLLVFVMHSGLMLVTTGELSNWLIYEMARDYMIVPAVLFLGLSLASGLDGVARRNTLAGVAMIVWLLIAQTAQRLGGEWPSGKGMWWGVYLLAFPFAAVMKDGVNQKGLRLVAAIGLALSLVLVAYAGMLSLGILPDSLRKNVYWDGARLMIIWHSNINACCMMIGVACALFFFFQTENPWKRGGLAAAAVLNFFTMVLTNSRTSILITCALIAGTLFFFIFRGGWKRLAAGALAAAVVFGMLFTLSDAVYDKHYETRLAAYISKVEEEREAAGEGEGAEAEPITKLPTSSGQGTLSNDMKTLNGRTRIWESVLWTMRCFPSYYLRGTVDIPAAIQAGGLHFTAGHTHNSWIEILVGSGLPALLIALYFTFLAVRGALFLLLKTADMGKKCVALLTLCLLMAGVLEPYLFTGYFNYHFIGVVFFLCAGYVNLWREETVHPERV